LVAGGPELGPKVARGLGLVARRRYLGLKLGPDCLLVYIGPEYRLPGEDRYPVGGDGQESAVDRGLDPAAGRGALGQDPHHAAGGNDAEHRRMAAEDADVAVKGLGDHPSGGARPDLSFGHHQLDAEAHRSSSLAVRSRPSMPPHMKTACAGTWSYLPSLIALNEATVSSSGTNAPSMPVNCSATNIGWDRNRSIRRARWTVTLSSSDSSSMPRIAMMSWSSLYFCRIRCTSRATA